MTPRWAFRLQVGLVLVLFLGALGVLLGNPITILLLPDQEAAARARLRAACQRLAEVVASGEPVRDGADWDARNRRLADAAHRVLLDFPGVEGGYYLAQGDRFAGYAFPSRGHRLLSDRTDPPPLEAPYLRLQARQSLVQSPGDCVLSVQDIGPSRVVLVTEAVGDARPARVAAWALYRLSGPEQLEIQARRYAASTALALGGICLALLLTWNLGRRLARQRREQELLRDELRRAEHLAGLGKLLAGVAHEVRNPLAGIRSTAQLWQRLPEARTAASVDALVGAVDRLNAIVTRLLQFSRAELAERRPVDLNRVAGECLDLLQARAAEQGVTLERDLAADLPCVSGSAVALHQLVLNLLTNALQTMPGGGRLHCATRRLPRGGVALRVADTGPGIDADARRHLFEPFFTTRPEGTGLGLALCREVALAHGGVVELEETAPGGTTFRVELPESRPEP